MKWIKGVEGKNINFKRETLLNYLKTVGSYIYPLQRVNQRYYIVYNPLCKGKEDAGACMEDGQCIGLGLQICQLRDNIKHLANA